MSKITNASFNFLPPTGQTGLEYMKYNGGDVIKGKGHAIKTKSIY